MNQPRDSDSSAAGVTIAIPLPRSDARNTSPSAPRSCGTCTACCDGWVAGTIRGHAMHAGTPCHFRGNGCCTIYAERPGNPCRNFVCGWLMPGSPLPEAFRPDRLGVLVVPTRWRGALAFILVHGGRDPDGALLDWMRDYARKYAVPFFYEQRGQRFGFGPPEFQSEMAERAARGERLW